MKNLTSAFTQNLHHAYVIEGSESIQNELVEYIEGVLGIETRGNPDVYIRIYDTFGIDDGRAIQILESRKAVIDSKKIFILRMSSITREAQNALLKTFEEPHTGTHFFMIIPSSENLLKTLLSRVHVVSARKQETSPLAQEFLYATPAKRIKLVADIIESKDKQEAIALVNGLEIELYTTHNTVAQKSREGKNKRKEGVSVETFESLQSVRSYLNDRSASVKILLEHLCVTLPQYKSA